MKIFVSGATGFQGSSIATTLLKQGHDVTTISRTKHKKSSIQLYQGDLANSLSLKPALKNTDAAVFTLPLIFDIELAKTYTSQFIDAAISQEVPLVIFNTGFDLPVKTNDYLSLSMKTVVQQLFDSSSLPVITLVPDVYLDNLIAPWSIPVIMEHKIIPYPIASHTKIPWISHEDLARFVAATLHHPELVGKTLPIGGHLLTGEEIAASISDVFGETIQFVSLSPDEFEEQIVPAFGKIAGKEISNLYRYVAEHQSTLIQKDFQKTQELLAITPTSLSDWATTIDWPSA